MFLELAKHNRAVERFLISRFDIPTAEPNFDEYKVAVRSEFFPSRGYGDVSPSIAYRMIRIVEEEATSPRQVIDFIYYCVETGVAYTNAYGDINEEFYIAFEDLFEYGTKLASINELIDDFSERAYLIVTSTSEIGWGFHDELKRIFAKCVAASKDD